MTDADIERMAREAGYDVDGDGITMPHFHADGPADERAHLARFAALVRAQALQDAARECDAEFWRVTKARGGDAAVAAGECADAIRALVDKP